MYPNGTNKNTAQPAKNIGGEKKLKSYWCQNMAKQFFKKAFY